MQSSPMPIHSPMNSYLPKTYFYLWFTFHFQTIDNEKFNQNIKRNFYLSKNLNFRSLHINLKGFYVILSL